MPVFYLPYQSSIENKDGKKLFYPRVVRAGNISTEKVAEEVTKYSSLSSGDVKNTIDNLITVMTQHLQNSQSVTLDGLGTFRMVMLAGGKGVETADEVSAAQASLTVRFQPCFTKKPDRSMSTRSMVTGVQCLRYDSLINSQVGGQGGNKPDGGGEDGGGEAPDPGI